MVALGLATDGRKRVMTDPIKIPASDIGRYQAAVATLDRLIDTVPQVDRSPAAIRARAERRLIRVRRFLDYLGNPQAAYPVVHVTGTSGKGSTCTAIASILRAAGYRHGLHT